MRKRRSDIITEIICEKIRQVPPKPDKESKPIKLSDLKKEKVLKLKN